MFLFARLVFSKFAYTYVIRFKYCQPVVKKLNYFIKDKLVIYVNMIIVNYIYIYIYRYIFFIP